MPASYETQAHAVRLIAERKPADLVRSGIAKNTAQAELLLDQILAAAKTVSIVASDERVRRYVTEASKR